MADSPFHDHNRIALPPDAVAALVAKHQAAGLTDDGTRKSATRLETPIAYYDPGHPVEHGPAIVATNTLQQQYAIDAGFIADEVNGASAVARVRQLRAAAQAAKDAE